MFEEKELCCRAAEGYRKKSSRCLGRRGRRETRREEGRRRGGRRGGHKSRSSLALDIKPNWPSGLEEGSRGGLETRASK